MKEFARCLLTMLAILLYSGAASRYGVSGIGVLPPDARRPLVTQLAKLTASDGQSQDAFGWTVSMCGDTIAVGAPFGPGVGAAYVFMKPATGWHDMTETAELTVSTGTPYEFGASVAIRGNTIVVGAPEEGKYGATFVYVKSGGVWQTMTEVAELTDARTGLGEAVAINEREDTIALGSCCHAPVDVFVRPSTGWTDMTVPTAKLTTEYGDVNESVSISGDTVVGGAPHGGSNGAGVVFVYSKPSEGWHNIGPSSYLYALDGRAGDEFGTAVSIDGDEVAVGAPGKVINIKSFVGAAYVFEKPAKGWGGTLQTGELTGTDAGLNQSVGMAIDVSGSAVAAGGPSLCCGNTHQGAVYGFLKPSSGWHNATQNVELVPSDGFLSDQFGYGVAISDKTVVAGAPLANGNQVGAGAAYVFGKSQ